MNEKKSRPRLPKLSPERGVSAQREELMQEIAALVNLYIASSQLHSTLDLARVTRLLSEVLAQLVGARSYAVYLSNLAGTELLAISAEGLGSESLRSIRVQGESPPLGAAGAIERVFLTGVPQLSPAAGLVACLPMTVSDRVTGAIAIFSLLPHKQDFTDADRDLLSMLGAHSGTAFAAALLYSQAEGKVPGVEAFLGTKGRT
jgi:GAF domain-containing protein